MSYKISQKSNQDGVIELLLQPSQPRSPWLNVQIDQRNPKNLMIKAKTPDEISYILLAPFLNSHKEVHAQTVETELSQFIAAQNYGVALVDRRVVRLEGQAPKLYVQPKIQSPVLLPKHMMGQNPKKAEVPGGKQFKKEVIERRDSEDFGLMAFGSEKRAEVLKMLEAKGVGAEVVSAQPKARFVPKLAAKSRLLNPLVPVEEPKVAHQPISPKLPRNVPFVMPKIQVEDALPVISEEADEELDFALALSLQQEEPALAPRIPRFPSPPLVAPSPNPNPNPHPVMIRPAPFNPEFLDIERSYRGDQAEHLSRRLSQLKIDLDAEYAAKLAKELEEEDLQAIQENKKLREAQEAQDAYMVKLLAEEDDSEARQKQLQREEHDRILAAQLDAKERQKAVNDHDRLNREAIEKIQKQDLMEEGRKMNVEGMPKELTKEGIEEQKEQMRLAQRLDLCRINKIDVNRLNEFENLILPPQNQDAHHTNRGFVRSHKGTVETFFDLRPELMDAYGPANGRQADTLRDFLALLVSQPHYNNHAKFKEAVQNIFGPYAKTDKEIEETGEVSLKDMLVRIYVLLQAQARYEGRPINDTQTFKFLIVELQNQRDLCFQGAIARMFSTYFAGVRYYYNIIVGSQKQG